MAKKKDKDKDKDKDKKAGRTDAVRAAVDQAFAATAGGAQLTRERAQELRGGGAHHDGAHDGHHHRLGEHAGEHAPLHAIAGAASGAPTMSGRSVSGVTTGRASGLSPSAS